MCTFIYLLQEEKLALVALLKARVEDDGLSDESDGENIYDMLDSNETLSPGTCERSVHTRNM